MYALRELPTKMLAFFSVSLGSWFCLVDMDRTIDRANEQIEPARERKICPFGPNRSFVPMVRIWRLKI